MLKTLFGSIREYKKDSLLAPFFVIIEVFMEVLIPFYMANIIDLGIEKGNLNYIVKLGVFLFGIALVSLICGVLAGKYAAGAAAGFAKNLRKDMFHKIQDFSFSNIDKFSTASLVTRLTTDVTNVQIAYQMIVRMLIRSPIMLFFALVFAIKINLQVSIVFFIAIPVLGVLLFFIAIKAHPHFERVFNTYDKLNNVVQENVTGVRVVKAYVREDYEVEKFGGISKLIFKFFTKAEKIVALNTPIMQFTIYTCILAISYLAARLITFGAMTTGELTSMVVYASQILSSLMILSMVFVMVLMAQTSAERIVEVLNEESNLSNGENPKTTVKDGSIDFENVDFSYGGDGDNLPLRDINLHIDSGKTVGIIGSTGSSKTSLVQLIPRLYDVTKGSVKVGGVDVREYDIETLRNEVAMVLQKNTLFAGTIKDNLRWGNENATDEEIIRACRLSQADTFIEEFPDKYDTKIEQGGTNVSGGQKQRLCIARALLKNPKILILDDSTSAVDTKTDAFIRKSFREEIPGTTKIIIAQRISSVEDADMIIVMDNGMINQIGTHEELIKENEIYKDVYNSQVKGGKE
ncbi:ABC transporter ATP-binding protein [Anaerofustis stercorihominis]|uniref:ABC transporter, ATP-binding protein n=1 Tax=Anaerofustis stercorihominis DSM 17244 TaxID=445971 RepID=B1CC59_9FIRM|nr:ABC transporter transmembrane domain-containing protein [Anaerofustis stercorihominis]EDS71856.1 ABC transporter, ATP-binding protein [Anaerofustis stercorihominis DSM 17244]